MLKSKYSNKFINGPINKNDFLKKKFPGITEYISKKFNKSKTAMLIYNKDISVCPITTHLPIKMVAKISTIKRKIRNGEKLGFSERARAVNKGLLPSKAKKRKNVKK